MNIESIQKMVLDHGQEKIESKVKGLKVMIGSRYHPKKPINSVYAVIGYNIGKILEICGAEVDYQYIWRTGTKPITKKYDLGLICYYDTDVMLREIRSVTDSYLRRCRTKFYYTNLIPCVEGFDAYFLSRKAYLNPNKKIYKNGQYNLTRTQQSKKSFYVGRGVDTYLFYPDQSDKFTVLVDGSRGPAEKRTTKISMMIAEELRKNGIKVNTLGFNGKGKAIPKKPLSSIVPDHRESHVYISAISGLYEMPVMESQACGSYVISYLDNLHKDLMNPDTSFVCNKVHEVLDTVNKIKENYDPMKPRSFVTDNYKWTDICQKIIDKIK